MKQRRTTIKDLLKIKLAKQRKIICLTAYSYPIAKLVDEFVDVILVGDTVGMVLYGLENTLAVDIPMMLCHTKAVKRASTKALIITDLPFASYQKNPEQAFENASLLLKAGASAVKLEGGIEMAETIKFLTQRGIPVIGHIGVMPQHINQIANYQKRGREELEAQKLQQEAKMLEEAGCFAIVLECILPNIARQITEHIQIPTIGIGSNHKHKPTEKTGEKTSEKTAEKTGEKTGEKISTEQIVTDGHIFVTEDILNLGAFAVPPFVSPYANLAEQATTAIATYAENVAQGKITINKG